MGELGEVGQRHRRIGADLVLRAQFLHRAGGVAAHHRLEQVDGAGAIGKTEHLPHVLAADGARGMRDRLVEQRQ